MYPECRTFVYSLYDPREPERVRYVGKTERGLSRIKRHFWDSSRTPKTMWLDRLKKAGVRAQYRVLEICEPETVYAREIFWIAKLRSEGHSLTNSTVGGDGARGWKPSKEQLQRMSDAQRGNKKGLGNKHMLGRRLTNETRLKMRIARLGRTNSPETRALLSAAAKARPLESRPTGKRNGRYTKPESTARGERHGRAKFSAQDVTEMLLLLRAGKSRRQVREKFGVSASQMDRIATGHAWTHLR